MFYQLQDITTFLNLFDSRDFGPSVRIEIKPDIDAHILLNKRTELRYDSELPTVTKRPSDKAKGT